MGFINEAELSSYQYNLPQGYFYHFWEKYKLSRENYKSENPNNKTEDQLGQYFKSVNGGAFETIIGFLMIRENIQINSHNEKCKNIENIKPDFLIKNDNHHTILSLKTTPRERWKQADWEAIIYKKFNSNTRYILLINSEKEFASLQKKLPSIEGIDKVVLANSKELNELISSLK